MPSYEQKDQGWQVVLSIMLFLSLLWEKNHARSKTSFQLTNNPKQFGRRDPISRRLPTTMDVSLKAFWTCVLSLLWDKLENQNGLCNKIRDWYYALNAPSSRCHAVVPERFAACTYICMAVTFEITRDNASTYAILRPG